MILGEFPGLRLDRTGHRAARGDRADRHRAPDAGRGVGGDRRADDGAAARADGGVGAVPARRLLRARSRGGSAPRTTRRAGLLGPGRRSPPAGCRRCWPTTSSAWRWRRCWSRCARGAGSTRCRSCSALACAANVGSAATLIGNPQNMLIGQVLDLSFAGYLWDGGVPALLGPRAWCGPSSAARYRGRWHRPMAAARGGDAALRPLADAEGPRSWSIGRGGWRSCSRRWPREVVALAAAGVLLASTRDGVARDARPGRLAPAGALRGPVRRQRRGAAVRPARRRLHGVPRRPASTSPTRACCSASRRCSRTWSRTCRR